MDPRGAAVLQPMMAQAMEHMPVGDDSGMLGMEMMSFIQDLPLTAVLGFFGSELPGTPEQIVDGLLAQIE